MRVILDNPNEIIRMLEIMRHSIRHDSPNPIYTAVLLTASKDTLTIRCGDSTMIVQAFIRATIYKEGSIAVSAKLFLERLQNMLSVSIILQTTIDGLLYISSEESARTFRLASIDSSNYPQMPELKECFFETKLDVEQMKALIKYSAFSISNDMQRPALNAAFFEITDGVLRMTTTDSCRLTKVEMTSNTPHSDVSTLLSKKGIRQLQEMFTEAEKSGEHITFRMNPTCRFFMTSKLFFAIPDLNERFPHYSHLIPQTWRLRALIDRESLKNSLQAMLVLSGSKKGILITVKEKSLHFSKYKDDLGGEDEIPCTLKMNGYSSIPSQYETEEFRFGINPQFLLDSIEVLDDEFVSIEMQKESTEVITIRASQQSGELRYISIIMPIRIE